MHILTAFFSSPLASTSLPLSSTPDSCHFSSPFHLPAFLWLLYFLMAISFLPSYLLLPSCFSPRVWDFQTKALTLLLWPPCIICSPLLFLSEWVCGWLSDDRHTATRHRYRRRPPCTPLYGLLKSLQPDSRFVRGDIFSIFLWITDNLTPYWHQKQRKSFSAEEQHGESLLLMVSITVGDVTVAVRSLLLSRVKLFVCQIQKNPGSHHSIWSGWLMRCCLPMGFDYFLSYKTSVAQNICDIWLGAGNNWWHLVHDGAWSTSDYHAS